MAPKAPGEREATAKDIKEMRDKIQLKLGDEAFKEYWKGMNAVLVGKVSESQLYKWAQKHLQTPELLSYHTQLVAHLRSQLAASSSQPSQPVGAHPGATRSAIGTAPIGTAQQVHRLLRPLQPWRTYISWEYGGAPTEQIARVKPSIGVQFALSARGVPTGNVEHGFAFPHTSWITARLRAQAREHKMRAVGEQCADVLQTGLRVHMQQLLRLALEQCRSHASSRDGSKVIGLSHSISSAWHREDNNNEDDEGHDTTHKNDKRTSAFTNADDNEKQQPSLVIRATDLFTAASQSSHSLGGERDYHLASFACLASENTCSDMALSNDDE